MAPVNPFVVLRTVGFLKAGQVVHRLRRRLRPLRRLPGVPAGVALRVRKPVPAAVCEDGGFDGKSFVFLNRRRPFEGEDRWAPGGTERLWVYNLHYFRYLAGLAPATAKVLLEDWIRQNLDPAGPGWEPYPLSLRIREWIEWAQANPELHPEFKETLMGSIAQQALALEAQVEYDLMGNHLLENAITLCWAGLSLECEESERWLNRGARLLRRELAAQVLSDGAHEERSPMYQALLAEALLRLGEVARQGGAANGEGIAELAQRSGAALLASLKWLVHPDGEYALLNDSALGIAPTWASLRRRFGGEEFTIAGDGGWSLPDAGYWGWAGREEHFVFDAGPLGPDHQPGHGHADTLAFEWSLGGRRIFTDTGVYEYEPGERRAYDRSTAAHNTAEVDGRDQCELWASFRCGRRVRLEAAEKLPSVGGWSVGGAYRGGRAKGGRARHRRVVLREAGAYRFTDEVVAAGSHTATLHLHLAPGLTLRRNAAGWGVWEGPQRLATVLADGFDWREATSPYHPEFGREIERRQLVAGLPFRNRLTASWAVVAS